MCVSQVFAETPSVQVIGNIIGTVITPSFHSSKQQPQKLMTLSAASSPQSEEVGEIKHILLQQIVLSKQAQQYLDNEMKSLDSASSTPTTTMTLPSQVDLGMNSVPVLDQGIHGTCATFASTAIIDAVYSKDDYISQLCNLELTDYLHPTTSNTHHGWDGSTNSIILDQIKQYGIISKSYQQATGCAGEKEYPLTDPNNIGHPMSTEDFRLHSEPIMSSISIRTYLEMKDAFSPLSRMGQVFGQVKQALTNQHRVVIGFLLDTNKGGVGAYGHYRSKTYADSWIMTPEIKSNILKHKIHAGHAIIIVGYDDNAIITGSDGSKHVGAFILRNSWGPRAGYQGNYFMSYEYFKELGAETIEVLPST